MAASSVAVKNSGRIINGGNSELLLFQVSSVCMQSKSIYEYRCRIRYSLGGELVLTHCPGHPFTVVRGWLVGWVKI